MYSQILPYFRSSQKRALQENAAPTVGIKDQEEEEGVYKKKYKQDVKVQEKKGVLEE
jgi:hypothetical protein